MDHPQRTPGRGPERRGNDDDGDRRLRAADRRLAAKLDKWALHPPRRANVAAIGFTAFLMVWLLAGTRDLQDRASTLSTLGVFLSCVHAAAHMLIAIGLRRLDARGIAAAERAWRAYLARVTQRDVAIAWGLFALIPWL